MTVTLELPPDAESGLLEQAQALGLSLEAYAAQVLLERGRTHRARENNTARARAFEGWARSHPRRRPLPDEALRREGLVRPGQ